ncbi:MAG: hypothetical protein IT306_25370 [Chloroflexi bacterium]|nr:hypothetical protein [Chloroflexota bacterium]
MQVQRPSMLADRPGAATHAARMAVPGLTDGWPTRRPSLAYQWALDQAARAAWEHGGSRVVVADHPLLGQEAMRRLGGVWFGQASLAPEDARDIAALTVVTRGLSGPTDPRAAFDTALWIEPTAAQWPTTLASLSERLAERGQLLVICTTPLLGRNLPERAAPGAAPVTELLSGRAVANRLLARGWTLDAPLGFRGVRALGLSVLERAATVIRRPALADRLGVSARAAFVERGWLAHLGSVVLLRAHPPQAWSAQPGAAP